MDAYLKLIEQVYPSRFGEKSDILIYMNMELAYTQMKLEQTISETSLCNYRIAFFSLRKHVYNTLNDAITKIQYELNEQDKQCLVYFLNKLDQPLYNKAELDVIIDNINALLSCYDLSQKNIISNFNNKENFKASA